MPSTELATKDWWDKLQVVSTLLGAVAVPVVLLLLGHWLTQSLLERETKARFVELAVEILRTDPEVTSNIPGLRDWAVDIINDYSRKPLPLTSAEALVSAPLRTGGCCVTCGGTTICGTTVKMECGSCSVGGALP